MIANAIISLGVSLKEDASIFFVRFLQRLPSRIASSHLIQLLFTKNKTSRSSFYEMAEGGRFELPLQVSPD